MKNVAWVEELHHTKPILVLVGIGQGYTTCVVQNVKTNQPNSYKKFFENGQGMESENETDSPRPGSSTRVTNCFNLLNNVPSVKGSHGFATDWLALNPTHQSATHESGMITYVNGNLLDSPAKVLVNTVNTEGVMGKGIAKEFKRLFPEMFRDYQRFCELGQFKIGQLWLFKTPNKWVLNFPTKNTWRKPSELAYLEAGLENFVNTYVDRGITSIAFPPLGCGNGELNWENEVRPLMEKYLKKLPIDVFIHLYKPSTELPEHKQPKEFSQWLRSEPHLLTFPEVLSDIKAALQNASGVITDPQSAQKIEMEPEGDFILRDGNEVKRLSVEDFTAAWNILRRYGYLMREIVPSGLADAFTPLVILLGRLPYCRIVGVSTDYASLSKPVSLGVQLAPNASAPGMFEPLPQSVKGV